MRRAQAASPDWADPDYFRRGMASGQTLAGLILRQLMPAKRQRTFLTVTGWFLVLVALGIGSAAYNTASNILFLTLSILLSTLILSGILSVINFSRIELDLRLPGRIRAGGVGVTEVVVRNRRKVFPAMGIWFDLRSCQADEPEKIYMRDGLAAGATRNIEWPLHPKRRGRCRVGVAGMESEFPFGFLRRRVGREDKRDLIVWPRRIPYTFTPGASGRRHRSGATHRKIGQGTDLVSLRAYQQGDPPRLIHWKATAREGRLMIRQLVDESEDGYSLRFRTDMAVGDSQFETLCSLACSLAEDLFHQGRLRETVVDDGAARPVRCKQDLHDFFDQLALAERRAPAAAGTRFAARGESQVSFRPVGREGIAIHVGEHKAGQAEF